MLQGVQQTGHSPGVGCRQSTMSWSCDDLERWTECSKPSRRQLRGTSCELQQPGQFLLCETGDHGPKPPHDLIGTSNGRARSGKHSHKSTMAGYQKKSRQNVLQESSSTNCHSHPYYEGKPEKEQLHSHFSPATFTPCCYTHLYYTRNVSSISHTIGPPLYWKCLMGKLIKV